MIPELGDLSHEECGLTTLETRRLINEWNKLSTDCVTTSSMNMFKNNIDTYLRRAGYI